MQTAPDEPTPALATAVSPLEKRDLLGNLCFYLHFAVMIFIVSGWALPSAPLLVFYLAFLPLVALQWQFNKNSCVLNNIESWLRTRSWRDPNNREEGAWLMTLAQSALGLPVTALQVEIFTYAVLVALWLAGLSHIFWW